MTLNEKLGYDPMGDEFNFSEELTYDEKLEALPGRYRRALTGLIDLLYERYDCEERLLSTPTRDLEVSVRASNCLKDIEKSGDAETIRELTEMTPAQLLKYKRLGRRTLAEIEETLKSVGLKLKESK